MKSSEVFNYPEGEVRYYNHICADEIGVDENNNVFAVMRCMDIHKNGFANCQGGAIYSLCDIAAAAWTRIQWRPAVTVDGSIQYLSPGKINSVLTATVHPRKTGRKIAVVLVEVYDDGNRHIADASFNMMANE